MAHSGSSELSVGLELVGLHSVEYDGTFPKSLHKTLHFSILIDVPDDRGLGVNVKYFSKWCWSCTREIHVRTKMPPGN